MEYCMEAARALKSSSLRGELPPPFKSAHQQVIFDDILSFNSNTIAADDFSVDCFFDFSNGDINQEKRILEEEYEEEEEEEEEEEKDSLSVSSQDRVDDDNSSNFASELAVPLDELAELEWVSQFVDDSPLQFPVLYPFKSENQNSRTRFEHESQPASTKPLCFFPAKVPAKARSKRARPTGRTWSFGSSLTDSSSSVSSSSPLSSNSSTLCHVGVQTIDSVQPPIKKPKRKPATQIAGSGQVQRRCSHCQVQKTPQWRAGPLGPKTLCNACGVRYKSGRLFPEYRPACSPTFSGDVHSNSHRRVLEIRKRKEMVGPESGLNQMVQSF